jgi:hypothetical protein
MYLDIHGRAVVLVPQVLETLLRIRRQDPLIYQKDVRFFPEEEGQGEEADGEEEEDEEEGARKPKRDDKPMYLRTVLAQQVGVADVVWLAAGCKQAAARQRVCFCKGRLCGSRQLLKVCLYVGRYNAVRCQSQKLFKDVHSAAAVALQGRCRLVSFLQHVLLLLLLLVFLLCQALAGNGQEASGSSSDEEGGGDDRRPGLHPRSYVAEQDELKKAFLEAADEVAGGSDGEQEKAAPDALGGVLRKRKRAAAAGEEGGDQEQQVTKVSSIHVVAHPGSYRYSHRHTLHRPYCCVHVSMLSLGCGLLAATRLACLHQQPTSPCIQSPLRW